MNAGTAIGRFNGALKKVEALSLTIPVKTIVACQNNSDMLRSHKLHEKGEHQSQRNVEEFKTAIP